MPLEEEEAAAEEAPAKPADEEKADEEKAEDEKAEEEPKEEAEAKKGDEIEVEGASCQSEYRELECTAGAYAAMPWGRGTLQAQRNAYLLCSSGGVLHQTNFAGKHVWAAPAALPCSAVLHKSLLLPHAGRRCA